MAQRASALVVGNDSVVIASRRRVAELAVKFRLPAIYATREFVSGGLLVRRALSRSLSPRRRLRRQDLEKPADLPVEQPTKFGMVISLKAAKAIGLEFPPLLLARADEVIE
jgi:putative tryptophan/tyrosine transport system substrate-binding protein